MVVKYDKYASRCGIPSVPVSVFQDTNSLREVRHSTHPGHSSRLGAQGNRGHSVAPGEWTRCNEMYNGTRRCWCLPNRAGHAQDQYCTNTEAEIDTSKIILLT